jgi:F-type H+-transporting ATPase subunit gamma
MGNLREIRNRIGSVKNTRKITSAMSRIASARMVKAQQAATAARPYGARISEVVRALTGAGGEDLSHPLMTARPELRAVAVIVVTADRGLCGAFNGNVIKAAVSLIKRETAAGRQVKVITVGRKGASFLENAGYKVAFKHEGLSHEQLVPMAKAVGTEATGLFLPQEGAPAVDAVHLIFNFFKNVLVQETRVDQLLPFQPPETTGEAEAGPVFEPSRAAVLEHLLPIALEAHDPAGAVQFTGRRDRGAAHGDGLGHRQRLAADHGADPPLQPRAPGRDHQGAHGDHRRRRGPQGLGVGPPRSIARPSFSEPMTNLRRRPHQAWLPLR